MITPPASIQQRTRREITACRSDVVPLRWTGWDFSVSSAGRELTRLSMVRFRDRRGFAVNGAEHEVYTQGLLRRSYRMQRGGFLVQVQWRRAARQA
jgi:hypothetical protein